MTEKIKSTGPGPDNECKDFDCDLFMEVDCNDGKNCANCELLPCTRWGVEDCEDCGEYKEATINNTAIGGFNRPLCINCRAKEMKRIDKFHKLYGHLSTDKCPDMRKTIDNMRFEEIRDKEIDEISSKIDHDWEMEKDRRLRNSA